MTKSQIKFKADLIKQVHISKKYQSFFRDNKEEYQDKLFAHFGVRSSKDLNIEQLIALVDYLNYKTPELATIKDRSKDATERQLTVIRELGQVYATDKSEEATRNFIYRITKNRYLNLKSISKADATKCILALKKTLKEK